MTVPFMYNFRSLSSKCPTIFLSVFFISLARLGYFCRKKETENFLFQKCDGEGSQKNPHIRNTLNCI